MEIIEIINELKKYDHTIFSCYNCTTEGEIINLEKKLKFNLPKDFKEFLLITNGADIYCQELYGIKNAKPSHDLFDNYIFETKEAGNAMPEYILPIYPDGMGNHECLDLSTLSTDGEKCNVIFWQHDRLYSKNRRPDIDAHSFTEYLESLLKEIETEYNHDGTEKIK